MSRTVYRSEREKPEPAGWPPAPVPASSPLPVPASLDPDVVAFEAAAHARTAKVRAARWIALTVLAFIVGVAIVIASR